jgi:hypothetical protein
LCGAARRVSPVGTAHGDVEIPHPIAKCDGSVRRTGDWTAVDGRQFRRQDLLGVGPVHLRLVAHNAAAVMSFRFAGCGIGQVDVVVDFPAAGLGRDHPASLITRTSACHETCFLRWNCCSAFDFAQTRDEELSPSRKRRTAGEIRQLLSRNSLNENGGKFCICTFIAPFKTLSH